MKGVRFTHPSSFGDELCTELRRDCAQCVRCESELRSFSDWKRKDNILLLVHFGFVLGFVGVHNPYKLRQGLRTLFIYSCNDNRPCK